MGLSFKGDAIVTTITAGINASDTTIQIASNSGWPSGAGGKPFAVELRSADGLTHEKALIASRSGTTLTVASRGYDDTVAASFLTGATIEHVYPATAAQAAEDHIDDLLPHPDSDLLRPANHDAAARHQIGDGTSTALLQGGTPVAIGTTASAGSGHTVARGNHSHILDAAVAGSGIGYTAGVLRVSVDDTTLAISGDNVIVKDGGVGSTQLASLSVTIGKIGPDAVDGTKIADDSIDSEHVVDGSIDPVHLAASLPRGYMGGADRTADSSDFATETTIPSFSVTATPVSASRQVEVEALLKVSYDAGVGDVDGSVRVKLLEGTTEIYEENFHLLTQGTFYGIVAKRRYTPTAGAKTWTVKVEPGGNADTVTVRATSGKPSQLTVTDIGGS